MGLLAAAGRDRVAVLDGGSVTTHRIEGGPTTAVMVPPGLVVGGVRALDAATGRVLWRAPGSAAAVAAGRVYAQPAVLDLVTGERRGTLSGRLISTGRNAFVEYGGDIYEVGEEKVAQMQKSGGSSDQLTPNDIRSIMGQMQDWFPSSDTQEDADLDGEPVTRVTGKLDLSSPR